MRRTVTRRLVVVLAWIGLGVFAPGCTETTRYTDRHAFQPVWAHGKEAVGTPTVTVGSGLYPMRRSGMAWGHPLERDRKVDAGEIVARCVNFAHGSWGYERGEAPLGYGEAIERVRGGLLGARGPHWRAGMLYDDTHVIVCLDPVVVVILDRPIWSSVGICSLPIAASQMDRMVSVTPMSEARGESLGVAAVELGQGFLYGTHLPSAGSLRWYSPTLNVPPAELAWNGRGEAEISLPWGVLVLQRGDSGP